MQFRRQHSVMNVTTRRLRGAVVSHRCHMDARDGQTIKALYTSAVVESKRVQGLGS
jgi:hypothetical protein